MAKGSLSGQVSGPDNKPLQGVRVQIGWRYDNTDRRGRFSIGFLTPGVYNIVFSKKGYGGIYMPVTIVAGANPPLNVNMVLLTGTLTGKVSDSVSGTGIPGVSVQVGSGNPATTAADGTFGISGIIPGTYPVTFTKSGYQTLTV